MVKTCTSSQIYQPVGGDEWQSQCDSSSGDNEQWIYYVYVQISWKSTEYLLIYFSKN